MIIAIQGNVNDMIQSLKEQKSQCSIKANFKELKRKIRVLMCYKNKEESKSDFQKILHLRNENKAKYIEACKEVCKSTKGISFDERCLAFRVQYTTQGTRHYVGQFKNFDEAKEHLTISKQYNEQDN